MTTPQQSGLDPERVGKLAAELAALAGAETAYRLAVAQETLAETIKIVRDLDQKVADRDAELARLRTTNERLQQHIAQLEVGSDPDVDVDEDEPPAAGENPTG